jgi:hypothetical protein
MCDVVLAFLDLFPYDEFVALGRVAAVQLKELDVSAHYVRHPLPAAPSFFASKLPGSRTN